ncbi:polysaccharide pyruvyl transferase family protein [Herbiconiux daphne]|uniref:Polysaccharide pyruvyl transferase family protein n=1 Tax=Herbiconiux daphne TaxID=2970914 RepID=A0ABT2H7W5_9MICO|nr:polysaccharide pyruvyl transferase family protein [Herbiconiux daphne]MCS5736007.1 polysaccharide pyruvyl transferase family protein [Herbiconiux daphne]
MKALALRPGESVNLVLLGDVGVVDEMIHIGDEAMFDEALEQLRRRGASTVTAISANPPETAARYGIETVARVGFSSGPSFDRAADDDRLRRVELTAAGQTGLLAADDPAHAVIEAVRHADLVLVTGGGNMASNWPLHIFERATLARIAAALGRPFVVSGQTIGPRLEPADAGLVAGLLASARRVGLREGASFELCRALGVDATLLHQTVDDASFVGDRAPQTRPDAATTTAADAAPGPAAATSRNEPTGGGSLGAAAPHPEPVAGGRPYCAVTLSTHLAGHDRDAFVRAVAALLDDVLRESGLEVVFVAHFGSLRPGEVRGDSVLHELVAAAMAGATTAANAASATGQAGTAAPTAIVPTDSVSAAGIARGASLVVTSRYHPAVFAVSGGVPVVGIAVDDYTSVKLTGALGNFGQDAVLTIEEVLAGAAPARVREVWSARAGIRTAGLARAAVARDDTSRWWDDIARLARDAAAGSAQTAAREAARDDAPEATGPDTI